MTAYPSKAAVALSKTAMTVLRTFDPFRIDAIR
jgi:hypothetical protein